MYGVSRLTYEPVTVEGLQLAAAVGAALSMKSATMVINVDLSMGTP